MTPFLISCCLIYGCNKTWQNRSTPKITDYILPCRQLDCLERAFLPYWKLDEVDVLFLRPDPSKIPWETTDAVFVAEWTAIFKNVDKAKMHLRPGRIVNVVVVSTPNDGQMLAMGVNHTSYEKGTEVCSFLLGWKPEALILWFSHKKER